MSTPAPPASERTDSPWPLPDAMERMTIGARLVWIDMVERRAANDGPGYGDFASAPDISDSAMLSSSMAFKALHELEEEGFAVRRPAVGKRGTVWAASRPDGDR